MKETYNKIENCRIITAHGSDETNGVFLKLNFEMQEDGSNVGVPVEFYTGNEYSGKGYQIDQETMKVWMKNCKVPDEDVEKIFGIETTVDVIKHINLESVSSDDTISTETDKPVEPSPVETSGAIITTEASLTGKASMPQPDSSETTIRIGVGASVATTEAALTGYTSGSEEDDDKGAEKGKKKKKSKNRTKHQKNKAKKNKSSAMVENTFATVAAPTQSDTDILVDAVTPGDCLRCSNVAGKICAKCKKISNQKSYYCSKECWDEHLAVHDQICSLYKPKKKFPYSSLYSVAQFKSVYGILLADTTTRPSIVDVTIERKWDTDVFKYYFDANSEKFLGNPGDLTFIYENPLKPNRKFPNFFAIFYLSDNLLTDKSMPNKCVQTITGGQTAHHWRGPILVLKCWGTDHSNLNPIDVDLSDDFIDIIDFLKTIKKEELRKWRC